MDCPICKEAMVTLELNEVEIDYCTGCGGIWLDAGELETLLGQSEQAQVLLASFDGAKGCKEKPRKCPICMKKMEKVLAGPNAGQVLIDRCRREHGLWFDRGELVDIFGAGQFDGEHKVQGLLTEMFASDRAGDCRPLG